MFFIVGCCLTIFTWFCSVKHFCQEYYVGDLLAFSVPHIRKHDNSFILLLGMLILMAWLWQYLEDFSIVKGVVPFEMKSPVCWYSKTRCADNLSPKSFRIFRSLTEWVIRIGLVNVIFFPKSVDKQPTGHSQIRQPLKL